MPDIETVLVTGGTGFLGSYLTKALVDEGHEVVAFDVAALARAVRETGTTRIVHLAALLTEDVRADALEATRVNTLGTNDVLEAARLFPDRVTRVVLTSSETVYAPGSSYDDTPVEEDALLCPDSPYSAAKRYAECPAETYREEYDVPAVALRPTGVFGPYRRGFTAFSELFENPAVGEPARVHGGKTTASWLYVNTIRQDAGHAPVE